MWTLAFGHHEDRTPTHGYQPTREAAMAAFAKSWRRDRAATLPACRTRQVILMPSGSNFYARLCPTYIHWR